MSTSNPGVQAGLREHGIDVRSAAEAGLISANDKQHLEFALSQQRVIVTHDDDFLVLHAQGERHAGIVYCHQRKYSVGQLLRMLLILHSCYTAEEMRGRVGFLQTAGAAELPGLILTPSCAGIDPTDQRKGGNASIPAISLAQTQRS